MGEVEEVFSGAIEQESEKDPPIEAGTVFDPEIELKTMLKFSGKEREEKFNEYKEKFTFQKEGLDRMYGELWDMVDENPDLSLEEMLSEVTPFFKKYGLNLEQRISTFSAISEFAKRRRSIHEALEKYFEEGENGPHINERRFFEGLFCAKPFGKIEIIRGPVSVFLRCYDARDYARARTVEDLLRGGGDPAAMDETLLGSRATALRKTLISALDNAVTLENYEILEKQVREEGMAPEDAEATLKKESAKNFLHEEQHAVYSVLKDEARPPLSSNLSEIIDEAENEEERRLATRLYFKNFLPFLYSENKDEILARVAGASSADELRRDLEVLRKELKKGRLYDLRKSEGKAIIDFASELLSPEQKKTVQEAADEVFGEKYERKLDEALDAVLELLAQGFTPKQLRAKLFLTPLDKWRREVLKSAGGAI